MSYVDILNLVSIREQPANGLLYGERQVEEAELICFENPKPGRPYEISIELPEFTCKCPFSGYPDFAILRLLYQPGAKVIELKSIKLYINSFRDRRISHEESANQIIDDLVAACDPVWMQLEADFNPRGNVHMLVRVSHGNRKSC
mgnify:CR=1 FL=1